MRKKIGTEYLGDINNYENFQNYVELIVLTLIKYSISGVLEVNNKSACKIYQNNNSIRGVINCVNKLTLLDNSTDFNEKIFIFIPKNSLTLYLTK